ncbi:GNAT family N-acetyltransferase [[Clostridium] dakarense]|uniref:GNAT family N-acetyltransferase n=1 Tax=Faecalimicrobium dakarense TaxID=1301100 RepID=UPI0004B9FA2F|nr:GNAT family N-acetyltransferase [[Clostridium] dakarense]
MKKVNVITYYDKLEWKAKLNGIDDIDIYFTPEYCKIYEDNGDGEAKLFEYEDEDVIILYPFLCRVINKLNQFSNLKNKVYDISTPYGYGGPLIKIKNQNKEVENSIKSFSNEFHKYCLSENIISEFIRFHPLLQNQNIFKDIYKLKKHNTIVFNCTEKDIEEIWNNDLQKSARNAIRKSRKNGIEVFVCDANSKNYNDILNQFKTLYYSTMDKRNASNYYYFNKRYFSNFRELLRNNHKIFYVKYDKKIVAASIVMVMGDYIHMHLSASNKEYLYLSPNNSMDYEIIKWANYKGYKFVHHGGGTSSDPDDKLLKYKASFSKDKSDFYLGYKIHNRDVYKKLCDLNENIVIEDIDNIYDKVDYFPLYRYNL